MKSLKRFFLAVLFALFLFSLQNIDGKLCTRKNFFCPNTTLSYDTTNDVVVRGIQRELTRNILSSPLLNHLSPLGRKFVAEILNRLNTDSPSQMFGYYIFSFWSIIYLANPYEYLSLCPISTLVNGSVNWATVRDGNIMASALRVLSGGAFFLCKMVQVNSLSQLGCENVPDTPAISSRCYQIGKVYQVQETLDLFGQSLPCSIQQYVLDLYSSSKHSDNVLAAMFSMSLSPLVRTLMAEHDQNILIETFNMLIFNNVSVCCCAKRNQRFNQMCVYHSVSLTQNINTMINNTIFYDECATVA